MAVRVPDLPFPTEGATSKLAWFGATLLLATPSELDRIRTHNERAESRGFGPPPQALPAGCKTIC